MIEPGQEERGPPPHPGVADHEVLDRGALGVPEVERAGDIRRRLDDHEWLRRRVRARAGAVRSEHVGSEPPLVDRAFVVARRICPRQIHRPLPLRKQNNPLAQRTNGSWYHLLVRRPRRAGHPGPCRPGRIGLVRRADALVARYRTPTARLASDLGAVVLAGLAPSPARWVADPALLLSVTAVRPGV